MQNIHFAIASRTSHQMVYHEVHPEIEMYYLYQGERIYFVEDRTYLLTAGSVLLINSSCIHKTASTGNQPHARMLLLTHPDFLKQCGPLLSDVSLDQLLSQPAVLSAPDSPHNATIRKLFEDIARLDRDQPPGYEAEIQLNTVKLLLNFHRTLCSSPSELPHNSSKYQKIYDILRYIGTNMDQITSLDMLCQEFFISKYYLCHSFKKITGLSVITFLNMTRVLRASVLLQDHTLTPQQVGKAVGFKSYAHFTEVFKRRVGFTPNEYRRQRLNTWG